MNKVLDDTQISLLNRCCNTTFSDNGIQWFHRTNILICSYKNKKEFSNLAFSLKLGYISKTKYEGKWLSFFNYNYSYTSYNTFFCNNVKNHLNQNKPLNTVVCSNNFNNIKRQYYPYCLIGLSFNSDITLWSHTLNLSCNQNYNHLHKTYQQKTQIDSLISSSYFPFIFNIDSEFVDLKQGNTSPYSNIRNRFPLSLSITLINIYNYTKQHIHFIFDINDFNILKQNNPLQHIYYTKYINNPPNFNFKDLLLLDKENPFFMTLTYLYQFIDSNINTSNSDLFLCNPDYVKNNRSFRNCLTIPIFNYFSAKDFHYLLGSLCYKTIEPFLESRRILSFSKSSTISPFGFIYKTCSTVTYLKVQFIDISGLSTGGLKELSHLTNVNLDYKHDSLLNKENMKETLKLHPKLFLEYATQDAEHLTFMGCQSWANLIEIYEIFNVTHIPSLLNFSNSNNIINYMRFTSGSNIATFFEEYIYSLDPSIKTTLDSLSIRSDNYKIIEGISMGSSRYLNYLGGHAALGAFVSGGRVSNERPYELCFQNGADIDLSSCYGTSIRNLEYPLGIPSILRPLQDTVINQEGNPHFLNEPYVGSLKNVMNKYKKNLIPGLWYAVVSTNEPLSFSFDLLISKNISLKGIVNKEQFGNTSQTVPGEQLILTREIKNGILTHPLLDIIDKVSTRNERKELYEKLHIKTMVFYDKKHRCNNFKEFNIKVMKKIEKINRLLTKNKNPLNKDSINIGSLKEKPLYWISIPMKDMIDVLINKRKEHQNKFKETHNHIYDSKQRYVKLVINMIYGITASRYFNVSNLCFANNITSLARCSVWIMAKALNLCQCITDGGIYELDKVNYWHEISKKRKPGLNILANNSYFFKKVIKPLAYEEGDLIDWEKQIIRASINNEFKSAFSDFCDELVSEHIHNFMNYYNLTDRVFPYKVEHKTENFFFNATTLNRGHYALLNLNGNFLYKIRGTQQKTGLDHIPSPIFEILKAKMFKQNAIITNLCYTKSTLVKTEDLKYLNKKNSNHNICLGDTIINKMTLKIKKDDGKYPYLRSFISSQSKGNLKSSYSYLMPYYLKNNLNQYKLSIDFWKDYHGDKIQNSFNQDDKVINKRNNKNNLKEIEVLVDNAKNCDSDFDPVALDLFKPSFNSNTLGHDQNDDYIPELTDDIDENKFIDVI